MSFALKLKDKTVIIATNKFDNFIIVFLFATKI